MVEQRDAEQRQREQDEVDGYSKHKDWFDHNGLEWRGKIREVTETRRQCALFQRLQPAGDLGDGDVGLLQQLAHGEEAVELAGKVPVGHGHAGFLQPRGVFGALVAQGIGARGQHIGRRQAGERFGARGRGLPVIDVGGAVEIVVAEPFDHGMRQQNAGLGLAVRGMAHRKIGGGIDQHLAGELRAVAVARGKRHHGGEIAAGAVAADQQIARRRCRVASALAATHLVAVMASSTAAGNLCSGARR